MATDGDSNLETGKLEFSLDVPFPSSHEALIALRSLSPDQEPRRGGISKQLSVSGSTLRWSADEARILRVSVSSFLDHLSLVIETMEMFGPSLLCDAAQVC
uniref:L antigen family member 3 n=2 Tax=Nothobranchius TaxID=28779 RepID=A0A1A8J686_NOTKU